MTQPPNGLEELMEEFDREFDLSYYSETQDAYVRTKHDKVKAFTTKAYTQGKEAGYTDRAHEETAQKIYPLGKLLTYEQGKADGAASERQRVKSLVEGNKLTQMDIATNVDLVFLRHTPSEIYNKVLDDILNSLNQNV